MFPDAGSWRRKVSQPAHESGLRVAGISPGINIIIIIILFRSLLVSSGVWSLDGGKKY
jgi:hypothetical protein